MRTETYYAYDVTGKMVAVRNRDLAEDSKSTLGFAYQGNQQLLSFSLDTYSGGVNEYGKIKSFNLLGTQGEVLGIDSSRFGQPAAVSSLQQTVWQINNLDGTRFTDTNGWFATNYAFAGQKLASTNTDYLTQSRDAHRNTWNGKTESGWTIFKDEYGKHVNPRIFGVSQAIFGLAEVIGGAGSCPAVIGCFVAAHGLDDMQAGLLTAFTGEFQETLTKKLARAVTGSETAATVMDCVTARASAILLVSHR